MPKHCNMTVGTWMITPLHVRIIVGLRIIPFRVPIIVGPRIIPLRVPMIVGPRIIPFRVPMISMIIVGPMIVLHPSVATMESTTAIVILLDQCRNRLRCS